MEETKGNMLLGLARDKNQNKPKPKPKGKKSTKQSPPPVLLENPKMNQPTKKNPKPNI